ncbi:DUF6436 domain-containing protein [Aliidiomarina quisquiliarum]|uniref:DUF6436 domain-containing protein n=1 Tax=Aliidiomarina quisquiliarum TaxID=2938947 RepID=UPI00208E7DF3|nr:DUF6436 domain-containing protein [Aliidiomarina quisquiliarum]MCO4320195.1 DUF6436 domain-containing protein [Aliidiomarina quisquiliarum]
MNKLRLPLLVFVLWVVGSSVYLYIWAFSDYGYFDKNNQWLGLTEINIASEVESEQQQSLIIHIRQPGCRCNSYADQHANDLLAGVKSKQITLSVTEAKGLNIPVPATPMVAVFSYEQLSSELDPDKLTLVYAGPYASGPFCAADDSFLPAVLDGSIDMSGPWFNGGVKACRCAVAS